MEKGPYVIIYEHDDFNSNQKGRTMEINKLGITNKMELKNANMEDRGSSMKIKKGYRVVVFDKPLDESGITANEYNGGENGAQIRRMLKNDTISTLSVQYASDNDGVLLSLFNNIYNTGEGVHVYDYGVFNITTLFAEAGSSQFEKKSLMVSKEAIVTLVRNGAQTGKVFVGVNDVHRFNELDKDSQRHTLTIIIEKHMKGIDRLITDGNNASGFGQSEELISQNRLWVLRYENNGNLSLWSRTLGKYPIWQTKKYHKPGKVVLNLEGMLQTYDENNKLQWTSSTRINGGKPPYRLLVQDDRNVVIYDSENTVIWATETNIKI